MNWSTHREDDEIFIDTECYYCGTPISFSKTKYLKEKHDKGSFTYKCPKCSSIAVYEREVRGLMWCSPIHRGVLENKNLIHK